MRALLVAQKRRDQHHDLMDPAADVERLRLALTAAHGAEALPERRDQQYVFSDGAYLRVARAHGGGAHEPAHERGGARRRARHDPRETQFQFAAAGEDVDEIAIEK